MTDQLGLLTPEESRPTAKVLTGRPPGPVGLPEPFTLRTQGGPKQSSLPVEEPRPPASLKDPGTRKKEPTCYVKGCRGRFAERHTFTSDERGIAYERRRWIAVELCGPHADELTDAEKRELAK